MLALALQAVAAFNLVCTGTVRTGRLSTMFGNPATPLTQVYRIDLERRRYCVAACESTAPLVRVTDNQIVFIEFGMERYSGDSMSVIVNRETGRLTDLSTVGRDSRIFVATCERAPFTGFPQRRF